VLAKYSHSYFLPILSQCLPLFDEFCRRSIHFIRSCLSNESSLVRHISQYAVFHGRALSCLGQNVLFCMRRYNCCIRDFSESTNNIIKSFVFHLFDENMHCTANFSFELIMMKNNRLCIGLNDDLFSYEELQTMIDFVCTL